MMSDSRRRLRAALVAAPLSYVFPIRGYQTAEDAHAFHAEERTLLVEVEEWLGDRLPGERALADLDDFHGNLYVVIPDDVDAVMFKLARGEVIASPEANQYRID